jgi:mRNA interferase HigB
MHIITKRRILEARKQYPLSASGLDGWYKIMESNNFIDFSALKKVFSSVDKVGPLYVFNVGGNKLRLIASIHFNRKKVYIRAILTHREYDENKWKK